MAKLTTIIDRETGETRYPITSTRAVFDERGVDLETLMDEQKRETTNTLKGYATTTELTEGLATKQGNLSTTTDLQLTNDDVLGFTDMAKKRLFIDLWNSACGTHGRYNPETGYFELNGLTDITYEEAVEIYNVSNGAFAVGQCMNSNIKTNLWTAGNTYGSGAVGDSLPPKVFYGCSFLEVARIAVIDTSITWSNEWAYTFSHCNRLKRVIGIIGDMSSRDNTTPFNGCPLIETVRINRLNVSINLSPNPLISLNSFTYIVNNRNPTNKQLTITVHPDVYAKLTGDTTNAAAAELTQEELAQWAQVLVDASEKNIIFATT